MPPGPCRAYRRGHREVTGTGPRSAPERAASGRNWRAPVYGSLVAIALAGGLAAGLVPLRAQVNSAVVALVLVVPVVTGVSVGGPIAGLVAIVTCFFLYDYVFLPPYYTLYVSRAEDWIALAVYVVVMALVARVVSLASRAQAEAQSHAAEVRRLFDLSELLVRDLPAPELLNTIVGSLRSAFNLDGVSLVLPVDGRLQVAASAGAPLSAEQAAHLVAGTGSPVSLVRAPGPSGEHQAIALVATGRAVGLLAVQGSPGTPQENELLRAFANHMALALERSALQEEAVRARLLDEVDTARRALVGAVSHDLRTPLATIKLSASALLESGAALSPGDVKELAELVDAQADRLERLVTNLLDMTRIQAGALELRRQPVAVPDLVDEALLLLGRSGRQGDVRWRAPLGLPLVDVDPVLVRQVLANLLDNAFRYSPAEAPVTVYARAVKAGKVEVTVADNGPGVPEQDRARIFQMFNRTQAGGRGGLGLAIAQAFIEAHGERIWVEGPGGRGHARGARFVFTLPIAGEEGP